MASLSCRISSATWPSWRPAGMIGRTEPGGWPRASRSSTSFPKDWWTGKAVVGRSRRRDGPCWNSWNPARPLPNRSGRLWSRKLRRRYTCRLRFLRCGSPLTGPSGVVNAVNVDARRANGLGRTPPEIKLKRKSAPSPKRTAVTLPSVRRARRHVSIIERWPKGIEQRNAQSPGSVLFSKMEDGRV